MDIYLTLDLRNKKHDKLRSYFLYNKDKLIKQNINIEINYLDFENIDFSTYENTTIAPSLYNKSKNITINNYNDIIDHLHDLFST
jgi:hypothetical protein